MQFYTQRCKARASPKEVAKSKKKPIFEVSCQQNSPTENKLATLWCQEMTLQIATYHCVISQHLGPHKLQVALKLTLVFPNI